MFILVDSEKAAQLKLDHYLVKVYMKFRYGDTIYYLVQCEHYLQSNGKISHLKDKVEMLFKDSEAPDVFGDKLLPRWHYVHMKHAKEIDVSSNRQATVLLKR